MENFICTKYHHVNKGCLLARVDILIESLGMEIKQICIFQKNGLKWVSFPATPGMLKGNRVYYPFITIKDREKYAYFQKKVFECLEKVKDQIDNELQEKNSSQESSSFDKYEDLPF